MARSAHARSPVLGLGGQEPEQLDQLMRRLKRLPTCNVLHLGGSGGFYT